jgi:hypothetical protein
MTVLKKQAQKKMGAIGSHSSRITLYMFGLITILSFPSFFEPQ